MIRFIAQAWDPQRSDEVAASAELAYQLTHDDLWQVGLSVNGFAIFYSEAHPHSTCKRYLSNDGGMIFGPVYSRDAAGAGYAPIPNSINASESDKIYKSCGRRLIEAYWGNYVAFLYCSVSRVLRVIRAPRSSLTCFYSTFEKTTLFFSSTEDCANLGLVRLSVNWDALVSYVVDGMVSTSGSLIGELSELKAGSSAELRQGKLFRVTNYWDPFSISQTNPIRDFELASQEIHRTVLECTDSISREHPRILHTLSGGIDSSIVLGALRASSSKPTLFCYTHFSHESQGDERVYARAVAATAEAPIIEQERDGALRFERMLSGLRTAVPTLYLLELTTMRPAVELAKEYSATAISTGTHGDVSFYLSPAFPAAVDAFRERGLSRQSLSAVLSSARLEQCSVWKIIGSALRMSAGRKFESYASIRRQIVQRNEGRAVLNPELIARRTEYDLEGDPTSRIARSVGPGKLWHIYQMATGSYEDPFANSSDPQIIEPLGAQPVAEVCLRIPVYVHLRGGWDRAAARHAFRDKIPGTVLNRTVKGSMNEHIKNITMRNLDFVRDHLFGGVLVQNGVLNKRVLDDALSSRPTRTLLGFGHILLYLGVEIWLSKWQQPLAVRCEARRSSAHNWIVSTASER